MSRPPYLRGYMAGVHNRTLVRTLVMLDPNDNAKHRYEWAWIDGQPVRRRRPERGDFADVPAQWEPVPPQMAEQIAEAIALRRFVSARIPHPIIDFFVRFAPSPKGTGFIPRH